MDMRSQYTAAISKLREMVEALEPLREPSGALPVDVSLLSEEQWVSLIRVCAGEQDVQAAETVIDLMNVRLHGVYQFIFAHVLAALQLVRPRSRS